MITVPGKREKGRKGKREKKRIRIIGGIGFCMYTKRSQAD
jgi:hypothetical protein